MTDNLINMGIPLVVDPSYTTEQLEEDYATVCITRTLKRARLPRSLFNILHSFSKPCAPKSLVNSDTSAERIQKAVSVLVRGGYLLTQEELQNIKDTKSDKIDPMVRLFASQSKKVSADFMILGVPYDLSNWTSAGSRFAPEFLRMRSYDWMISSDKFTARPLGWYDAGRGKPVLKDAHIVDEGDVRVIYGEPVQNLKARIGRSLKSGLKHHDRIVILGGDSIIIDQAQKTLQSLDHRAPNLIVLGDTTEHNFNKADILHINLERILLPGCENSNDCISYSEAIKWLDRNPLLPSVRIIGLSNMPWKPPYESAVAATVLPLLICSMDSVWATCE